jgi:hypothetical protein
VEVNVGKCHLGRYSTAPPSEGYNVARAELEERREEYLLGGQEAAVGLQLARLCGKCHFGRYSI